MEKKAIILFCLGALYLLNAFLTYMHEDGEKRKLAEINSSIYVTGFMIVVALS